MENHPTNTLKGVLEKGRAFTYENFSTKTQRGYTSALRADYKAWLLKVENLLPLYCGEDHKLSRSFTGIYFHGFIGNGEDKFHEIHGKVLGTLEAAIDFINYKYFNSGDTQTLTSKPQSKAVNTMFPETPSLKVEFLTSKFHSIVKSLETRSSNREPIKIRDEYDVQYLFKGLLHLYFHDIRPEEWAPSYGGGASRIDFVLPMEELAIEIKKVRTKMTDKMLGEELIIDIHRYQTHQKCKTLFCCVYDPDFLIRNPVGIEKDLSKKLGNLDVIVKIFPKK